jgi:hypothetical protein
MFFCVYDYHETKLDMYGIDAPPGELEWSNQALDMYFVIMTKQKLVRMYGMSDDGFQSRSGACMSWV